jgi:hypothetical protein
MGMMDETNDKVEQQLRDYKNEQQTSRCVSGRVMLIRREYDAAQKTRVLRVGVWMDYQISAWRQQ